MRKASVNVLVSEHNRRHRLLLCIFDRLAMDLLQLGFHLIDGWLAPSSGSSAPQFSLQRIPNWAGRALSIWRDSRSCGRRKSGTPVGRRIKPPGTISRTSLYCYPNKSCDEPLSVLASDIAVEFLAAEDLI